MAGANDTPQTAAKISLLPSVEQRLLNAEVKLPSDIRATNKLLNDLTESTEPLPTELALNLVLLQVHRNIILGKLDKAQNQLNIIEQEQSSVDVFSRILYFKALIELKRLDFEKVFILLNRMSQLDMGSLSPNHQFDFYILAANIYAKANVFEDATGYANKALEIAKQSQNKLLECRAINSMAYINLSENKFPELETLSKRVISHCRGEQYIGELVSAYFYLALWHGQQQQYKEEQALLSRSIEHYSTLETPLQIAKVRLHLAKSLMHSERLVDADAQLNQALEIITSSNDVEAKTLGFNIKALLLEKMGLLDDAMFYFKHYLNAHKASSGQSKSINLAYLQRRFESKVNRQARDISIAESELASLRLERTNLKNWVMLLSALLVASVSLFLFVFFKRKQTLSMIEQQQKDELTQCFNVDYGLLKARELVDDALIRNKSIAVIACNIDNMEAININFNYDFGDIFLHSFAMKLSNLRDKNMISIRKSGDEFVLVVNDYSFNGVLELVEDVHQSLNGIVIDNQSVEATLSTGCAFYDQGTNVNDADRLDVIIEQAMNGLAEAKKRGGNCGYYATESTLSEVKTSPNGSTKH